jgi:alkaline phosphatase D
MRLRSELLVGMGLVLAACGSNGSDGDGGVASDATTGDGGSATGHVRVGTYNIEILSSRKLDTPGEPQVAAALEVIARASPDILAIQELQYDLQAGETPGAIDEANNARRFADLIDGVDETGGYDHTLIVLGHSGFDWSGYDPGVHDPYFGPGATPPGLFNVAVISRHPILVDQVELIIDLAWTDLPESSVSVLEATTGVVVPAGFPLFWTGLLVAPMDLGDEILYLVVLHTTPPHRGDIHKHRNLDQLTGLRLLVDGALPGYEDALPSDARFVLVGDWNADGDHGDGFPEAIQQLLEHPRITPFQPTGAGTVGLSPEKNTTASVCGEGDGLDAADPATGMQFQLDYVLPSANLGASITGGMFYPDFETEPDDWALACAASNHMLLWADLPL